MDLMMEKLALAVLGLLRGALLGAVCTACPLSTQALL